MALQAPGSSSATVARSTVRADWPGLGDAALFEGRDLKPTLDTVRRSRRRSAGTFDLTPRSSIASSGSDRCVRGAYDLIG